MAENKRLQAAQALAGSTQQGRQDVKTIQDTGGTNLRLIFPHLCVGFRGS